MKRFLVILLSFALIAALFSGCAQKPAEAPADTQEDAEDAAPADDESAPADEAELSGDIDMFVWWSSRPEVMEGLVAAYEEENPGVTVNLTFMTGEGVEPNLEVRAAADNMPDVTSGNVGAWYYQMADDGYYGDVGDTTAFQKSLPAMQTGWTSPGGVKFGVPYGVAYMYCYYNMDKFAEAGIEKVPESWQEWMDCCEKLAAIGIAPIALPGASSNNIGHNVFSGACAGCVTAVDKSVCSAGTLMLADYDYNNELFINAFKRAQQWMDSGYVMDGCMSMDKGACVRAFASEDAAMSIEGSWSAPQFINDSLTFEAGTFIPPYNEDGTPLYGTTSSETGFAIGGTANVNRELALSLFEFLAYDKFADRQQQMGVIPPFKSEDIIGEIKLLPQSESCANEIASKETASPLMFTVMQSDVYQRATELTQEIMLGSLTPEEAVQELNTLQHAHFN